MKTNKELCIIQSIQGKVHHPVMRGPGYRIGSDGVPRIVPATAGITYNFQIGDCCMGLMGDHVEPGVSTKNPDAMEDAAYNTFACVGNVATLISGDAKGAKGFVTGKHGGADHVMVYFDAETLDKMTIDDKVLIKAHGQGIQLLDYPEIAVFNTDPELLDLMGIVEKDGYIEVPVVKEIPAFLMGSGLGSSTMASGDYDIMTRDPESYKELGLGNLRFGDIVLIKNHTNNFGPDFLQGSATVGVIIHGDSYIAGHGPGVTVMLTCKKPCIRGKIDPTANIAKYLKVKK